MKKSCAVTAIIALTSLSTVVSAQPSDSPSDPAPAAVAPAEPSAPAGGQAAQMVDKEFASYDLDKSGSLSSTEFSAWVAKLRKPATDGAAQSDGAQFSAGLFARADTDHNQQISKSEMTTLLSAARG